MLKKIFIIFIILLFHFVVKAQDTIYTFGEEKEKVTYYLGFRMIPTFSSAIQFALLYIPNGEIEEITIISSATFIAYAKGMTKCKANPDKEDFVEKNGIENEDVLKDIWKLRYKDYPFKVQYMTDSAGWSTNDSFPSLPSVEQFKLLNNFGIYKISDFAYGDNAFGLLKSLENETWVSKYKAAF